MLRLYMLLLLSFVSAGCFLFESRGELIYQEGKYSIRKKNLVSYYNASPDLYVQTEKGEVKINLNGFGKRLIAQEKIATAEIYEIGDDFLQIHFTTNDTSGPFKDEYISFNVRRTVDSIVNMK